MIELYNIFLNYVVVAMGVAGIIGVAYFAYKDFSTELPKTA